MKKIILVLCLIVVIVFVKMNFFTNKVETKESLNKPMVSLSTYSLYDIAKHIAGDKLELVMILPFGVEVHNFEPNPKLMVKIQRSALVVYSGAGLEPWIKGFSFKHSVINMSKNIKLRTLSNHKNNYDPHYWLDFSNMITATKIMEKAFIKISPKDKDLFEKNAKSYISMLEKLDADYKKSLKMCKLHTIIVNHNAFSYMAQRYDFHVESLSGFIPEAQPSAKNMIELVKEIQKKHIKTIFFEDFENSKAIKNIATEAKISIDTLQPLGNITANEHKKGMDYEDIMRENLSKLSKALECR